MSVETPLKTLSDIVYWRDMKRSGIVFAVGIAAFFAVGIMGWSSLGLLVMCVKLHLIARLVYFHTVGTPPKLPETWITEEEVQPHVGTFTSAVNTVAREALSVASGQDVTKSLQWIVALSVIAFACRLFGSCGFLFLVFVGAFTAPRVYELKHKEIDAAIEQAKLKAIEAQGKAQEAYKAALAKGMPDKKEKGDEKKKL